MFVDCFEVSPYIHLLILVEVCRKQSLDLLNIKNYFVNFIEAASIEETYFIQKTW